MSATIFVMMHKKYDELQDSLYRTLQVGKAVGESLPYLGDDTGENISAQNPYYGELTGYYWIWKNYKADDIIGVCHYRRYFLNDKGQFMNEGELQHILEEYDVIVSDAQVSAQTNRERYEESHNIKDLLAVGDAILRLTPEYKDSFDYMMQETRSYYANLLVTRHELFNAYCDWLFAILKESEKSIDVISFTFGSMIADTRYELFDFGFGIERQNSIPFIRNNNREKFISREKDVVFIIKIIEKMPKNKKFSTFCRR